MNLRVLFFASLREATGAGALDVELAPGATLSDLRRAVAQRLGSERAKAVAPDAARVALNREFVTDGDALLAAGDEVAFLPPVTGG